MSNGTLGQVVKRAISDAAFRRQLQADPEGALKGFDLTSDERAALRSGDASKLSSFGIDQRMSKAFALGDGAAAASRQAPGSQLSESSSARAAFVDQDSAAGRMGLNDDAGGAIRMGRIDDAGGAVRSGVDSSGASAREGTAFITADEAGNDAAPAALGSSDSSATTAFMTSDEMGSGIAAAQPSDGDLTGDALRSDGTIDPWAENAEHQG